MRHEHKHIIPVEWKNEIGEASTEAGYVAIITGGRVTKLRCECGDEVSR